MAATLLAELQVWHSRPVTPTRRVALGNLVLPAEPAPGFGGLLLGAVVAAYLPNVAAEHHEGVLRLIDRVAVGERIVQPHLQYRYQVDRQGLAVSVHQLSGDGDDFSFDLHSMGRPLAQVLGAVYALERLDPVSRRSIAPLLRRATTWTGPIGAPFVAYLTGLRRPDSLAVHDPRAWALSVLGFPAGAKNVSRRDVMSHFRRRLRSAHPDHGGDTAEAAHAIEQLGEARRILLGD